MNIVDLLRQDQGIVVRVSGGNGLRDDPFVVESCDAEEAALTQVQLLRGIEHGRDELWRIVDWEPCDIGSATEVIRIEALWFTPTQVETEFRAFYFNTTAVAGNPYSLHPLISWRGPPHTPSLPYELGWLHFEKVLDNARSPESFDQTIQYSGAGGKAGVYVYTVPSTDGRKTRDAELAIASAVAKRVYPDLEDPWPAMEVGQFLTKAFLSGSEVTVIGVAVSGSYFVKLRLTYFDDPKMREIMNFTLHALGTCVESAYAAKR